MCFYQHNSTCCLCNRALHSARERVRLTLRGYQQYWRLCRSWSTSAWMWPTVTPNTLFTLLKTSERSSPLTPSWLVHKHRIWRAFGCLNLFHGYFKMFSGGERGDRRNGGRADSGWSWHHQSRHRTRWSQPHHPTPPQLKKQPMQMFIGVCKWLWSRSVKRCFTTFLLRLCVHHPQEDGCWVPSAQCCDRVCRCSPWLGRPHYLCEWIFFNAVSRMLIESSATVPVHPHQGHF